MKGWHAIWTVGSGMGRRERERIPCRNLRDWVSSEGCDFGTGASWHIEHSKLSRKLPGQQQCERVLGPPEFSSLSSKISIFSTIMDSVLVQNLLGMVA